MGRKLRFSVSILEFSKALASFLRREAPYELVDCSALYLLRMSVFLS